MLKIKIQQESRNTDNNLLAGQLENVSGIRDNVLSTASVQNLELIRSALGTLKSDVFKKRTLPGPKVQNSFEHLIYHYYFKTDKVDRFEDKVRSVQLEKDYFRWGNIEGFTLIFNKLKGILKRRGLEPMKSIGETFDTDFHEAITNIPAPSEELKGKVVDEIEKGYMLKGKVIRFAKVIVGQ